MRRFLPWFPASAAGGFPWHPSLRCLGGAGGAQRLWKESEHLTDVSFALTFGVFKRP